MEKRQLGKTGLQVSVLGYGAMELVHLKEQDAANMLNAVLDGGINFIDTSPDYGPSEEYIGKAISKRRDEFYLASKCGCNPESKLNPRAPGHIWDRKTLMQNIDNSLKLLKTDYIDIWQLHGATPGDLMGGRSGEVIETLLELKKQKKVKFIGVSFKQGPSNEKGYPTEYSFYGCQEFIKWNVFDVIQIVYGGLTRRNEVVIDAASEKGVGMIIRGILKKYKENHDELFEKARLDELCETRESRESFLVRFAMNLTGLNTMIIGTRNLSHLANNISATQKGKLPQEIYHEAKSRLDSISISAEMV